MKHELSINVTKGYRNGGVATCRHVRLREKLLRKVLGAPVKLTVIVPGDSVEGVTIREVPEAIREVPEEKEKTNG